MRRSKLEKIYFKKQINETFKTYKSRKNIAANFIKEKEKKFFDNLNTSVVSNNKSFWKVIARTIFHK